MTNFNDTIYTAIPFSEMNSEQYSFNPQGAIKKFFIPGRNCYQCWYFIKVVVGNQLDANYRLILNKEDDPSDQIWRELSTTSPTSVYIASGYFDKRRFMLPSTNSFMIEFLLAIGDVEVYIGLNPSTLSSTNYIWKGTTRNGVATITVKSTDANFHMATHYYVYTKAVSGSDAIVSITLSQQKLVYFLANNHDSTFKQNI